MKRCPILKAGTMVTQIHTTTGHTTVHTVYHDYPGCMGEDCEWFENGFPAHPVKEEEK